ncbi:hypothetical protein [Pedobacter immunditicola]|uniref:hypothetical protein n=1 Tax=Pedobacter immunditicola TaxID=3133440 RepID=UPI0030ADA82D
MNKILILLLFVLCSFNGFGQVKTVFFDAKDKVTADSTEANSYAIYGKVTGDSVYVFKKYDLDGYLLVTGSFKDDDLTIAHGKFVYYDWINPYDSFTNQEAVARGKERYITLSGNFENGLRQGLWISYYVNGDVKDVANYNKNLLNGEYKSFEANGDLKESGQFVNNKKEGEWKLKGGLQIVKFENDKVISTVNKTRKQLKKEKAQQNKSKL